MSAPSNRARLRAHIYLSSNFWDGLWIVQQPIANEMAREEPVLYVERFVSIFTILREPRFWPRLFTWMRGARRLSPTLRVLAPLPLFHLGHRFPGLFRAEFTLQKIWIRWWARQDQAAERVLWIDNPLYECAIRRLGDDVAVYHVADEITAFPTSDPVISGVLERATLSKVDVVFAAANQLADDKRPLHPNTHTVWNAIDPAAFTVEGPGATLPQLDAIPSPRVAFIGVIDEWVDLKLLALAAARLPQIHFVLVGPSRTDEGVLSSAANIHRLGRVDRFLVPTVLKRCSASLVPFKKTKLTARIVPLKVFEALAAGIMPVCTDFSPDLYALATEGYVRVAHSSEEFIEAVTQSIEADNADQRSRLSRFGRDQTWRARWEQMRAHLDRVS